MPVTRSKVWQSPSKSAKTTWKRQVTLQMGTDSLNSVNEATHSFLGSSNNPDILVRNAGMNSIKARPQTASIASSARTT